MLDHTTHQIVAINCVAYWNWVHNKHDYDFVVLYWIEEETICDIHLEFGNQIVKHSVCMVYVDFNHFGLQTAVKISNWNCQIQDEMRTNCYRVMDKLVV